VKRIDSRTIRLSSEEVRASDYMEAELDAARSIPDALAAVKVAFPGLSDEFYHYLGE
jgi:hypothetical protein